MRKGSAVLWALLVLPTTFVLTSCGEGTEQAMELMEKQGTLSRVRGTEDVPAKYLLTASNPLEDNLYVSSDDVLLDKYLGDEIVAQGYFVDKGARHFMITDAREVEESADEVKLSTSYSNNELGSYFNYPKGWEVKEDGGKKVMLEDDEGREVFEMYRVEAGDRSFETWVEDNFDGDSQDIQLGLVRALRVESDDYHDVVVLEINDGFYAITVSSWVGQEPEVSQAVNAVENSMRFFMPVEDEDSDEEKEGDEDSATDTDRETTLDGDAMDEGEASSSGDSDSNAASDAGSADPEDTEVTDEANDGGENPPMTATETNALVEYIVSRPSLLPAEEDASVQQVELAGTGYVYVTFMDGDTRKKVLFSYEDTGAGYSFAEEGLFEAGEATDWVRVSGQNVARDEAREVFEVNNGSTEKASTVEAGKNLYSNSYLDFETQYPRNWYYQADSISSEGGIQRVTFSDKPLDGEPEQKVEVSIYGAGQLDLSGAPDTKIGGKDAKVLIEDGVTKYVLEGDDGRLYVTTSSSDDESRESMVDIIQTLSTE